MHRFAAQSKFFDYVLLQKTVKGYSNVKNPTLDDIINADKEARIITTEHINKVI